MDDMVEGEKAESLNRFLQMATYIIRKPLDPTMMAQLWKVMAWRKCFVEENMVASADSDAADGGGNSDEDDVIITKEPESHLKAVRYGKSQKRELAINDDDNNYNSSNASAVLSPRTQLVLAGGAACGGGGGGAIRQPAATRFGRSLEATGAGRLGWQQLGGRPPA
uniref:Uncharacterized protein n=1 Tax=Leersia perrieri TaxID=77586 RepID=A0A0D9WPX6_9ORYZ